MGVALFALALAVILLMDDHGPEPVTAADDTSTTSTSSTTTTSDPTTTETTTTTTATTTEASTTTAPVTTTLPPTTTPPTTAPPRTAPPTTMPATPKEFHATARGSDEGPPYYGVFYGTTFGGSGGFNVHATCRPGTVTVTVLEDGMTEPTPAQQHPVEVWVSVNDATMLYQGEAKDGQIISGGVRSSVRIQVLYPSNHDVRIKYDCRG
jgi:hypothetical protein